MAAQIHKEISMQKSRIRKSLFMAGVLVALAALVSCGGDVSQDDLDAV
ncbi:MAG: hypothetical protein IIB42_03325 [Candidatus Marinimicrobia bacterium]|nr:hypothetical protein [Candidatus Neomarinimicrobiota bacterium]